MKIINIENIDLSILNKELKKYENKWIAISDKNKIVSSGKTYFEAFSHITKNQNVVLFKVPRLDVFLSP